MALSGTYKLSMQTPMGAQTPTLVLKEEGGKLSGSMSGGMINTTFEGGTISGNTATWEMKLSAMGQNIAMNCSATVDGDNISGKMNTPMGGADFTGQREA